MTPTQAHTSDGLLLPGLDGTNPLGFLAALGVLQCLVQDNRLALPRLSWRQHAGTWIAEVHVYDGRLQDTDALICQLADHLKAETQKEHPAQRWSIYCDTPECIRDLITTKSDAWSACVGIEPLPDTDDAKRFSQLQIARKDYHVTAIKNLVKRSMDEESLRRTLLASWDYSEPLEGLTLHIDPSEDRRHAYQWNQPAGDPNRKAHGNMIAANRLALEAFVFFPNVHKGNTAQTTGFKGRHADDTYWTWPIWSVPACVDVIRSLLAMADLQEPQSNHARLGEMGIEAVYRSQRILVGKTPNFTPAQRIA